MVQIDPQTDPVGLQNPPVRLFGSTSTGFQEPPQPTDVPEYGGQEANWHFYVRRLPFMRVARIILWLRPDSGSAGVHFLGRFRANRDQLGCQSEQHCWASQWRLCTSDAEHSAIPPLECPHVFDAPRQLHVCHLLCLCLHLGLCPCIIATNAHHLNSWLKVEAPLNMWLMSVFL